MKIEKLTENKVRIILNIDDLEEKNINLHDLMSSDLEAQNIFMDILDEVEEKVGFNTKGCKIAIEAMATSDGNFIFTVTKSSAEIKEEKRKTAKVTLKRKTEKMENKTAIYSFVSFDEFCNLCTYINNIEGVNNFKGIAKNVSLYNFHNTYYLILSNINTEYKYLAKFYVSITEFAKFAGNTNSLESKIKEHGKVVMSKNAINTGIKYFITNN